MVLALAALHIAVLFIAATLLLAAAFNDAQHYKIPNMVCLALLLLFPVFAFTSPGGIDWEQHLMVFALILAAGFAMFMGNLAGAGDIKLMAVTGLWAGPHLVAVFLIMTAIAGGVVAVTMAILTYIRNHAGRQSLAVAKVPIPYGIAIAFGGLSILYMMSQPILFPS